MFGINEFGIVLRFLSITSQFAHNAKVIAAKRIAQLVNMRSMIIAYPGHKKPPLHKCVMDNTKPS